MNGERPLGVFLATSPSYSCSSVSVLRRFPGGCRVVRRASAGRLRATEGRLPLEGSGLLQKWYWLIVPFVTPSGLRKDPTMREQP